MNSGRGIWQIGKSFDKEEEFAGLDFHSLRLEERFIRTVETLCKQPDKSIREADEDRAEAKAICRMQGNENFDQEEILRARREAAIGRTAGYSETIPAVQDTAGARLTPEMPRSPLLEEDKCKLLYCMANKTEKGPKKTVRDKRSGRLPWTDGRAKAGAERRASRGKDNMAGADEVTYPAGLLGVPA